MPAVARPHLQPLLVVRWMPSGHARQMLWRPECNGDVLLSLDRPAVQESGVVTPQGEWRSLQQEEEKPSRSRALHPALGRALRWWCEPLRFPTIHVDPPALDNQAKRRRQAHRLAIERVYAPVPVRAQERQEQKVAWSSQTKRRRRSVFRENQAERFAAVARASDKDCGGR